MKKEIFKMPNADFNIHHSMLLKQRDGTVDMDFSSVGLTDETIRNIVRIFIIVDDLDAHAAFIVQHTMEDLSGVPVQLVFSAEICDKNNSFDQNELLIVFPKFRYIEKTYDALLKAKEEGRINLALIDAPEETASRNADEVFLTDPDNVTNFDLANGYGEQLLACYDFTVKMAYVRKKIDNEEYQRLLKELLIFIDKIQGLIRDKERIQWWVTKQDDIQDFFIVGNGIDYEAGLEGTHIIKDVSGFSCAAYDAEKLEKSAISSIGSSTLLFFILTQESTYERMNYIMSQCKNQGARLMAVTMFGNFDVEDIADFTVYLPKTDARFAASLALIPLLLLGYDIGLANDVKGNKNK